MMIPSVVRRNGVNLRTNQEMIIYSYLLMMTRLICGVKIYLPNVSKRTNILFLLWKSVNVIKKKSVNNVWFNEPRNGYLLSNT